MHAILRPGERRGPETPTFDKHSVAGLTHAEITALDAEELVAAIRAAELPTLNDEAMAHVEFLDTGQLRRILYMARECCRHQGY